MCLGARGSVLENTDIPWNRSALPSSEGSPINQGEQLIYTKTAGTNEEPWAVWPEPVHREDAWDDRLAVLKVREGTAVQPPAGLGCRGHRGLHGKYHEWTESPTFLPSLASNS